MPSVRVHKAGPRCVRVLNADVRVATAGLSRVSSHSWYIGSCACFPMHMCLYDLCASTWPRIRLCSCTLRVTRPAQIHDHVWVAIRSGVRKSARVRARVCSLARPPVFPCDIHLAQAKRLFTRMYACCVLLRVSRSCTRYIRHSVYRG